MQRYQNVFAVLLGLFLCGYLVGCPRELLKPATGEPGIPAVPGKEAVQTPAKLVPESSDSSVDTADIGGYQPAPIEQLQSAMSGLESFRVFGYYFKLQKDQTMLQALRGPTFEYIEKEIDPHLKLKKIKYDPTHQVYIASFLYQKAFLFWIHDDIDNARKTIAVLNRTFPQRHREIKVYRYDKGEIALDEALYELEALIGPEKGRDT